jgi:hypothetical protein
MHILISNSIFKYVQYVYFKSFKFWMKISQIVSKMDFLYV